MRGNEELVTSADSLAGTAPRYGLFYRADVASMRKMLAGRKIPVPRSATVVLRGSPSRICGNVQGHGNPVAPTE